MFGRAQFLVDTLHGGVVLVGLSQQPTGFKCSDAVGWVTWPVKIVPKMTYVLSGMSSFYLITIAAVGLRCTILFIVPSSTMFVVSVCNIIYGTE